MELIYVAPLAAALVSLAFLEFTGGGEPWGSLMVVTFFACKVFWFGFLAMLFDWLARMSEARTAPATSGGRSPMVSTRRQLG